MYTTNSAQSPLLLNNKRVIRRPDFRNIITSRLSGAPLTSDEVDYDELVVHKTWRSFEVNKPNEVRYFMYELSQKNPEEKLFSAPFYKAIRMIRLTRVPRYLRQNGSGAGPDMVFEQMRDVLAALREQGTLFINLVAKSPQLPLIFAYGVQGVGATQEEAQQMADEAFAVLDFQLSGTYQQLMYKPISIEEGELISRYQSVWNHLAMGRGRPLPTGNSIGTASILDGNRSDVESTNNQLESFIRGMSDKSFLLSLVTVPLSPVEIAFSWRNLTQKLSEVKSEISGTRSVNAGVAFPLVMGSSDGTNAGSTHSAGTNSGVSNSYGTNEGTNSGTSASNGISDSFTLGANHSNTAGTSETVTDGTSITNTEGTSHSTSVATGTNASHGVTTTQGTNESTAKSVGNNWSTSTGQSLSNSTTNTTGTSQSTGISSSQTISASDSTGTAAASGSSSNSGSNVSGGVLGTGGGTTSSSGTSAQNSSTATNTTGISQASGTSSDVGSSASTAKGVTTGSSSTDSIGGSTSITDTKGTSASTAISDTTGTSRTVTEGNTTSRSTAVGTSHSVAKGTSASETSGTSTANQTGSNSSTGSNQGVSQGSSRTDGTNSGVNDAWAMAYSRSYASSGSLAVAPNFGVSVSKQTFDAAKQSIADMLDAQLRRYNEGLKSGAFLYQMFLVCPDRETLVGGAGLLKSAFWGAGQSSDQLPQPFHTITRFETEERSRLLAHAGAFTSYRKREDVVELIEPFKYSSYLTPSEAAAFVHPPVVEGPGLLAVHDSMPVLRMPVDRHNCEIQLGHVINGERGLVSDIKFGITIEDLKGHALIAGVTGSGKTTTLMKLLTDAIKVERTIIQPPTIANPVAIQKTVRASILGLDWMRNMRNLASIPELTSSGRFKFYSLIKPELGQFRWNPLQVPAVGMTTEEWLNAQADNFTASFNLGEFGRSLIAEFLTNLYGANRLVDFDLRPEFVNEKTGQVRPAIVLPAIPESQIPAEYISRDSEGNKFVNAFTYPELSRCVSIVHLATLVLDAIEKNANPEQVKISGSQMKDRLQSLWRRVQYFAPGGQYSNMLACDTDLSTRSCLTVSDILNPDRGTVTVIETDGLDFGTRRLVLGSVLLAIYRFGLYHGDGIFDHNGKGPGCFVVMEESHELFGEAGNGDDSFSAETRTALYEGMFRRVRASGLRLIPIAQQPSTLPEAVTANINTVFIHKVRSEIDRKKVFALLNWSNNIGQQMREYRYLGELPTGYCIARIDAKDDYTESAPIQFKTEMPLLDPVTDEFLKSLR